MEQTNKKRREREEKEGKLEGRNKAKKGLMKYRNQMEGETEIRKKRKIQQTQLKANIKKKKEKV